MGANAVTTVPVYTAGEVLTAADMNITNSGIPVFATTTTRDAAFGGTGEKTLAEGQMAYIEATKVTQYYNGSAWVAVNLGNTNTAFTAGQQTTASTSYVALTTATAVTLTTGTSALVIGTMSLSGGATNQTMRASFAVSGATTVAASDNYSMYCGQSNTASFINFSGSFFHTITGLTPGSNTFSLQYKTSADTLYANDRRITVYPL